MEPNVPTTVAGAILLLGSVIVTGLVWTIKYLLVLITQRDLRIEKLMEDKVTREREISREEGPLLAAAADALRATPDAFERAVAKVVDVTERDKLMRRLEHTVDELSKRRRTSDDS